MTQARILSAALIGSALVIAPMSSAVAGGSQWSHRSYHAPAYRGGYHGAYWHGGVGYWRGGVWWPAAAAAAVVGTAAALVAAPFVAIGNAVASSAYVPPPNPAPYYPPQPYYPQQQQYYPQQQQYYPQQQQYYAPQGYNAPQPNYAPSYGSAPRYDPSVPPDYHAQGAPQYYDNAQPAATYPAPAQGYSAPPATYNAPSSYYRQRNAAVTY